MKRISIIIVNWNGREVLRNCLNSIRQAGGPEVREVVVVDNASSDGSPDMVTAEFSEVTLVRSPENLGFARANNLGLRRATGTYLALVNSDVIVHAGCFDRLAAFLDSHSEVGLVGPKVLWPDGHVQVTRRRFPGLWNMTCQVLGLDRAFDRVRTLLGCEVPCWGHESRLHAGEPAGCECSWLNRTTEVEAIAGCFWLMRREAFEAVGELDERFFFYGEDMDWCKRLWKAGWKVVLLPEATTTHFGGGSSANAPLRYSIEMLRANLAYWRKHHGILGQAGFVVLSVIHHFSRLVWRGLKSVIVGDPGGENGYKVKQSLAAIRWLLARKRV